MRNFGEWRWGIGLVVAVLVLGLPVPQPQAKPQERVFRVTARQFAFEPPVLQVNPGDRVVIELRSSDVVHGLYVEGYDVEAVAEPGQPDRIVFVADRPGTYRLRCSVTCGDLHPFMGGKLRVGRNPWLWKGAALALWGVTLALFAARPRTREGGR